MMGAIRPGVSSSTCSLPPTYKVGQSFIAELGCSSPIDGDEFPPLFSPLFLGHLRWIRDLIFLKGKSAKANDRRVSWMWEAGRPVEAISSTSSSSCSLMYFAVPSTPGATHHPETPKNQDRFWYLRYLVRTQTQMGETN